MAYGTPRGPQEVEAFYTHIRGGRPPSPELLATLRARYQAIGGGTPLLEITQQQADALQAALGNGWQVFVGMKHSQPSIGDVARGMAGAGLESAVGLALAPHYSELSVGAYIHAVEDARAGLRFSFVRSWHLQPAYLDAVAAHVRTARAGFDPEAVVFTAHSLPKRILEAGDPYVRQLQETARRLAVELQLERWVFSFQSAGASGGDWLGPDILETIDRLAGQGVRRMLVAPIGFISDHLEILYDLDVQARQRAAARGVDLRRIESLNAAPLLIQALKTAVLEAARA